jgi:ankyrin repeat protein
VGIIPIATLKGGFMTGSPDRPTDPLFAFLDAAVWFGSLDEAWTILSAHPEIADGSIHVAAVLGDEAAIARHVVANPSSATTPGGPRGWPPLLYLCLSKYLRLEPARTPAFVRAATVLLDAGADANTGVWINGEFESVLYGAAGVAHNPEMTRLLLDRGADPNDIEVAYHTPESRDNAAMKVLVETGRMTPGNLAMMLVRKADWHDTDGIRYLLAQGADPNGAPDIPWSGLHHAIRRDNRLEHIALMLDSGADPLRLAPDLKLSAVSLAARRGRADVLDLFEQRGVPLSVSGVERLILACARDDQEAIATIRAQEPGLVTELLALGGTLLAEFAGTANARAVANLLDLGVPVDARYGGDPYFDIPAESTALHVAAWRAWDSTLTMLLSRGAPVNATDGRGATPLQCAIRACVDSYWMERRTPEGVRVLLDAGASLEGVTMPSGYDEVDLLLARCQ